MSSTIAVSLNNECRQLPGGSTLAQALTQWGYESQQVAVAINGEFVPRTQYAGRCLCERDCLDVLAPVQGG